MIFLTPEWFFLLAPLAILAWLVKPLKLWLPLRALSLILIVLILAQPRIQRLKKGLDLFVLLDRSASTEDHIDRNLPEWRRLLERSKPSQEDRLIFMDFATEVLEQSQSETGTYPGDRSLTKTALALENTLALAPDDKPSRVLLFTDGYSTEPLSGLGEKLRQRRIPLAYRLVGTTEVADYRVRQLDLPTRTQVAEPFVIEIEVTGRPDGVIPLQIQRDGAVLAETKIELSAGLGRLRFTDRINQPGAHRYEAKIQPERDAHPGNNRFESWIEVTGGPRILLLTTYEDDPVETALAAQGFTINKVTDLSSLQPGQLAGTRAVILNNVPAYEIPSEFLKSLDFFVHNQGGGLLMAGGKNSFGSGGYFESPIDSLLPVSMELKDDVRKLAVAMAIVLDRSGSMSMGVGMAKGKTISKMDLANEGTAKAIELLGANDQVTVYAVDSAAHKIVPLMNVGRNRQTMIKTARRIQSTGGGIYVYNGLEAAWNSLKKARAGQKHVILFADAADAEQPGQYKRLVREMTDEGATVSVIGLGTPKDADAPFLRDVARLGNGRSFFSENPRDLPNIFSQETIAVARSTFVEDPVGATDSGLWAEISGQPFEWIDQVDGYNLSYLRKEQSSQGLISDDEFKAPLVAWVQRGTGRCGAVCFPLGGDYSDGIRSWEKYDDFIQTFTRWLMGEALPPGIGLRTDLKGTQLTLDLFFEGGDWEKTFSTRPPLVVLSEGEEAAIRYPLTWRRMMPGHYQVTRDLKESTLIRGGVKVGDQAIPFGPLMVGSSTEWAFEPDRLTDLKWTAEQSGGGPLLELGDAWKRPQARQFNDIRNWLLIPLFLFILLDALVTRMGWARCPRSPPTSCSSSTTALAPPGSRRSACMW
ncbi:MAG: vWA domain-containing protein [Verrucomicrobiota bacterium]